MIIVAHARAEFQGLRPAAAFGPKFKTPDAPSPKNATMENAQKPIRITDRNSRLRRNNRMQLF